MKLLLPLLQVRNFNHPSSTSIIGREIEYHCRCLEHCKLLIRDGYEPCKGLDGVESFFCPSITSVRRERSCCASLPTMCNVKDNNSFSSQRKTISVSPCLPTSQQDRIHTKTSTPLERRYIRTSTGRNTCKKPLVYHIDKLGELTRGEHTQYQPFLQPPTVDIKKSLLERAITTIRPISLLVTLTSWARLVLTLPHSTLRS